MKLSKFDQFFVIRKNLIEQYNKGDLSKDEYIDENFRSVKALNISPFNKIDNMKKAIFNYQYYNVLAKYYQKRAHNAYKDAKSDYQETSNYYYSKKDNTTKKLLEFLDYRDIEAYYVKVKSSNLKKKLFEIKFLEYEDVIFHSINESILKRLIEENVFINEERISITDEYINKKY